MPPQLQPAEEVSAKNRLFIVKKWFLRINHRLFYSFFGVLLLVLPLVHYRLAMDISLIPRLTVVSLLLLVTGLIVFLNKNLQNLDFSVFRQRMFKLLIGLVLVTFFSSFYAFNGREVYFDIVRTLVFAGGVAFASLLMLRTDGWREKISLMAVVAALPTLTIGAVEYFREVVMVDAAYLPDGRIIEYAVVGLMGHKNIYSIFLMLLLPFAAYGIYRFKGFWKLFALLVAALNIIMIVLLKTRSAWVGIVAGVFVALLLLLIFARRFHLPVLWRNLLVAGMLAGVVGLVSLYWVGRTADRFSIPGRVYSIFDTESHFNVHRINVWRGSMQMFADHSLTGVGPGNWKVRAPLYYQQQFERVASLNWLRPHNDFLWMATEKGILGFVLYVGIFMLAFFWLIRYINLVSGDGHQHKKIFALCIAGGLAAYLADSFFSFPYERIEVQVLLFIMIAAIVAMHHNITPKRSFKPPRVFLAILVVAFYGFGAYYGYRVIRAEVNSHYALSAMAQQEYAYMLHFAGNARTSLRSIDANGYPPEYFMGMAYMEMEQYQEALEAFEQARRHAPNNVWVLYRLGETYQGFGRFEDAKGCYREIIDIIPNLPGVRFQLGNVYFAMGEYQNSYDMLTGIRNWESDSATANNVRMLEYLLDQQ